MSDDDIIQRVLEVAKTAAKKAGIHARTLRNEGNFAIELKGSRDLVTEADLQCERIIVETIRQTFPDHLILSEEAPLPDLRELAHGPLWIIDPIDGTTNFAHAQHCVGISIGFAIDGIRQVGVVYCPFLDELFSAAKGCGAFLNDSPIRVRSVTKPEEALIATGFPYQREYLDGVLYRIEQVLRRFRDVRRLGACSVDICFTACGRLDGYYEDVKPWDAAAALVIAEEAGASIDRFEEPETNYRAWPDPDSLTPEQIDGSNLIVCAPGIKDALKEALCMKGS